MDDQTRIKDGYEWIGKIDRGFRYRDASGIIRESSTVILLDGNGGKLPEGAEPVILWFCIRKVDKTS